MELEVGDVVRLKSGGPLMTVLRIDGDSVVVTYYENGERTTDALPSAVLDKE